MKRGIRYVDGETLPGDPAYPGGAGNGVGAGSDGKPGCIGGNDPAGSKPAGPDGKVKKDLWRSSQLRDWLSDQGDPGGGTAGTLCGGEEADRKVCGFPDRAGRLCLCGCRKQYGISGGVHRGT